MFLESLVLLVERGGVCLLDNYLAKMGNYLAKRIDTIAIINNDD
jgi:hypothetical protein